MEAAKAALNKYLLTGASRGLAFNTSELQGFLTLNGQFASGIGTGVLNGMLDFVTPASQSDVVQGVKKSNSYFHFNQFNDISSFVADGMTQLRKTYRQ